MAEPDVGVVADQREGWPVLVLASGGARLEVCPRLAGLGASLTVDGDEHLDLHGGLAGFADGHTTGLPLLHPWANRVGSDRFEVGGRTVDLAGSPLVHRDPHGLPIHGTLVGRRGLAVASEGTDGSTAHVELSLRYDTDELLGPFPFPHLLTVRHELTGGDHRGATLRVTTTVDPLGEQPVPVAFGWHPYLRLVGAPRQEWILELPDRQHLALDDRMLPTGEARPEASEVGPLGDRTFDDAYEITGEPALALRAAGRSLRLVLESGYPFAQVYAPAHPVAVALEPMTAPADALRTGAHPWALPGEPFAATFRVEVG